MNKYQKYILDKFAPCGNCLNDDFIFFRCCPIEDELEGTTIQYGTFDKEKDSFNIKQDEDINKTKYLLSVSFDTQYYTSLSGIFTRKNGKWSEIEHKDSQCRIIIDFNDRIDSIKFVFANRIAADYVLKIAYTEADKDKYYEKVAKEKKEALEKTAKIKVSTGADLVNIYFQPCCDEYDHTEIKLFVPKDYVTVGNPYVPVQKPSSWSIIKKCDVPAEDFYKSINGLAYGKYAFILKQSDKNNQLLLETDYIEFSIEKPVQPEFEHINVI